jgi:hypothetical protein
MLVSLLNDAITDVVVINPFHITRETTQEPDSTVADHIADDQYMSVQGLIAS